MQITVCVLWSSVYSEQFVWVLQKHWMSQSVLHLPFVGSAPTAADRCHVTAEMAGHGLQKPECTVSDMSLSQFTLMMFLKTCCYPPTQHK